MTIASFVAGLALAAGLATAAPADAQRYDHRGDGYGHSYGGGIRHGGQGYGHGYGRSAYGNRGGYAYRGGYGRGYGYGGHGYRRGRVVCTFRHGHRRCFRPY